MSKNYWESENIRIRAIEDTDVDRFVKQRNDEEWEGRWLEDSLDFPASEKEARKALVKYIKELSKDDKRFLIIESAAGEYIGSVDIWYTKPRIGNFRYGIKLEPEHRGKGYGKEALIIILDFYFNELNYRKCSPTVYEYNTASQKFHENFGFIKEGTLRNEVYTRGKYHAMIHYGMLKNEFNNLYKHWDILNK